MLRLELLSLSPHLLQVLFKNQLGELGGFWDARLTSELIYFFIYLGLILITTSYEDKSKGDRYASILAVVGIVNLPIIKRSVDWWNTHQPASISKLSSPSIDQSMLTPLFIMTISFIFLCISAANENKS